MTFVRTFVFVLLLAGMAHARDLYVNPHLGDDASQATGESPLRTAQRAVALAEPGDTIHLLPAGAIYRQMISLRGKEGITIEGNGVTLSGADPLPPDGWEKVGPQLFRRRLPTPRLGREPRQLLVVGGRAERMGRSPTVHPEFPPPDQIEPGQFTWQDIDDRDGWLYVRGETSGLEWAVRPAGLLTSGRNRDITACNLNACHALNDGFNIHGDARGVRFSHVTGYENYDEGFSAHDTCQCWVEDGVFWGNDNAAFDINLADTYYRRCEFRQSVSVEVGFYGGDHRLDDCRIIAAGPVAFRLRAADASVPPAERKPASCVLEDVAIQSADQQPRAIELGPGVNATFANCQLANLRLNAAGARVQSIDSTLDGSPWRSPSSQDAGHTGAAAD